MQYVAVICTAAVVDDSRQSGYRHEHTRVESMKSFKSIRSGAESRAYFKELSETIDEVAYKGHREALPLVVRNALKEVFSDPSVLSMQGAEEFFLDFYLASKELSNNEVAAFEEIAASNFSRYPNGQVRMLVADWLARVPDERRAFGLVKQIVREAGHATTDEAVFSLQTFLMRVGRASEFWGPAKEVFDSLRTPRGE